jgi:hypothetical protein
MLSGRHFKPSSWLLFIGTKGDCLAHYAQAPGLARRPFQDVLSQPKRLCTSAGDQRRWKLAVFDLAAKGPSRAADHPLNLANQDAAERVGLQVPRYFVHQSTPVRWTSDLSDREDLQGVS